MDKSIKKWIWQHDEYPTFQYKRDEIEELLKHLEYKRGVLDGVAKFFNQNDIKNIEIETLLNEAIYTSEIEGEYLQRESVRASLMKRLDKSFDKTKDSSTHQTDALVEILIDCSINREDLTIERHMAGITVFLLMDITDSIKSMLLRLEKMMIWK